MRIQKSYLTLDKHREYRDRCFRCMFRYDGRSLCAAKKFPAAASERKILLACMFFFRVYIYDYIVELRALLRVCLRSLEPAPLDILVTHTTCPRLYPKPSFCHPLPRPPLTILNPDFMMLLPVHPRDAARDVNFYSRV